MKKRTRKNDLPTLQKLLGWKGIEVVIPFRKCQDVPNFLKRLDKFEKLSRKSKLIVGGPYDPCHAPKNH